MSKQLVKKFKTLCIITACINFNIQSSELIKVQKKLTTAVFKVYHPAKLQAIYLNQVRLPL